MVTTPSKPKLSTPVARSYSSASDSDETDDERRTLYTQKIKQQKIEKQKTEQQRIEKQKAEKQKEAAAAAAREVGQLSQKKKATEKKVIAKARVEKKKVEKKNSKVVTPDSQSDSESEDETTPTKKKTVSKDIKLDTPHRDASRLVSNRISFRKTREFDAKKTGAENVAERLSDLFVPEVNDNYFVSDSESDTDSGEDYEVKEYPTWQRNLSRTHDQATDPWPVQRKFGYSDTLKLEKRIKKICRVKQNFNYAAYLKS